MIKRLLTLLSILFLVMTTTSFAESQEDFGDKLNYLYFYLDNSSQTNKIAYDVLFDDVRISKLESDIYYNNELVDSCNYDFTGIDSMSYVKVICEIDKLGDGVYTFKSRLIDNNENILVSKENNESIYSNTNAQISFIDLEGNRTTVVLTIEGTGENIFVNHTIPKEVIPSLTENTKDTLIKTDSDFKILNEDPLIAWTVDKAPAKINYTINKKISDEDKQKFQVELSEDENFQSLKLVILGLIILIVGITLKPMLKKSKK